MQRKKRLENKIALITGASQGMGAAIAKRYSVEGAHVLLLDSHLEFLEEIDDIIQSKGGKTTLIPCDLEDTEKLESLGPLILKKFGKLDIFVANAATLGELGPITHLSSALWDRVLRINLTANFLLLKTLAPVLWRSDAPRVIGVTSSVASSMRAYWSAYAVSKRALEGLFLLYANETCNTSIKVNILDPGKMATPMRAQAFPGENPMDLPMPDDITDVFVDLVMPACTLHGQIIKAKGWKGCA